MIDPTSSLPALSSPLHRKPLWSPALLGWNMLPIALLGRQFEDIVVGIAVAFHRLYELRMVRYCGGITQRQFYAVAARTLLFCFLQQLHGDLGRNFCGLEAPKNRQISFKAMKHIGRQLPVNGTIFHGKPFDEFFWTAR